jgi:hypothetical protein|nr:MAG TPA: hypothetical protein [Crassvirales sp.]
MKSFITIIIAILLGVCNINAQSFTRNGNTFTQVSTKSDKKSAIQTKFTWKDSKGNVYPIFITSTGRCFVNKVSGKTGKEYKYYLKEDLAREMCKALNITYKEKQS